METAQRSYDPDTHLYPPEQNDAMQFAQWDRDRVELEGKYPGIKVLFHKPPQEQGHLAQHRGTRGLHPPREPMVDVTLTTEPLPDDNVS